MRLRAASAMERCAVCALASVLGCAACTGTEVGNPVVDVPVSLSLYSSDDSVELLADGGSRTAGSVEQVWVSIGSVRFVLDDDCASDRDERINVPGPIVAELVEQPAALAAKIDVGAYCRVRVPLERAVEGTPNGPDELSGYSVLVRGRREDGAPFQIRTRDKPDLVLRSRSEPFTLGEDGSALVLAFDLSAWLAELELETLEPTEDGHVLIDEQHEMPVLRAFEANLRESLGLYRDLNENGLLDGSEPNELLAD